MAKTDTFSANQFIAAIPGTGGIISSIARKVGCNWHTAKKYIEEYPTVNKVWQAEREGVIDLAEAKLIEAIKDGDLGAIKFYLTTIGKHRGFVERQEITGADGQGVQVNLVEVMKPVMDD